MLDAAKSASASPAVIPYSDSSSETVPESFYKSLRGQARRGLGLHQTWPASSGSFWALQPLRVEEKRSRREKRPQRQLGGGGGALHPIEQRPGRRESNPRCDLSLSLQPTGEAFRGLSWTVLSATCVTEGLWPRRAKEGLQLGYTLPSFPILLQEAPHPSIANSAYTQAPSTFSFFFFFFFYSSLFFFLPPG